MSVLTDPVLLGRGVLLAQLCDRLAAGRHALFVGAAGVGKSALLLRAHALAGGAVHALTPEERRLVRRQDIRLAGVTTLYVPEVAPAGRLLDTLAQALLGLGLLALPGVPPDLRAAVCAATPWDQARRTLPTLEAKETAVLVGLEGAALAGHAAPIVVLLDGLDRATPSTANLLARLQRTVTVVGATRAIPPAGALRTFFLTFGTLPVAPLSEADTRALVAYLLLAYGVHAADVRHLAREVVRRADGNPAAVRAMLHDAERTRLVSEQHVRDLQTRDDAAFFNMGLVYAPLLVVGGLVRVLMIGVTSTDLYIVLTLCTVLGYLVFRVFRPFFAWHPTPETR